MSITIDLPPAVVQAAMAFAESRHTTLERMVSDYLGGELLRSREVHSVLSRLDELTRKTDGRLSGEPYRFRRADAYEPEAAFA